jgi:hypothetical protein
LARIYFYLHSTIDLYWGKVVLPYPIPPKSSGKVEKANYTLENIPNVLRNFNWTGLNYYL